MKNFLEFLTEAGTSQASSQARKLNLKSDGHGGWLDSRGKFVAKTEGGKLKFYNQRDKAADEGPVKQMATLVLMISWQVLLYKRNLLLNQRHSQKQSQKQKLRNLVETN